MIKTERKSTQPAAEADRTESDEEMRRASDSDDDPVVAEYDVCIGSALKDNLQLLQYPLRPRYRQYGD